MKFVQLNNSGFRGDQLLTTNLGLKDPASLSGKEFSVAGLKEVSTASPIRVLSNAPSFYSIDTLEGYSLVATGNQLVWEQGKGWLSIEEVEVGMRLSLLSVPLTNSDISVFIENYGAMDYTSLDSESFGGNYINTSNKKGMAIWLRNIYMTPLVRDGVIAITGAEKNLRFIQLVWLHLGVVTYLSEDKDMLEIRHPAEWVRTIFPARVHDTLTGKTPEHVCTVSEVREITGGKVYCLSSEDCEEGAYTLNGIITKNH